MFQMTIFECSNCGKPLLAGDKEYCEKRNITECAECRRREIDGTRTIAGYNASLRRIQDLCKGGK